MKYYAAVWSTPKWELEAVTLQPPFTILASYHAFKNYPDVIKECLEKNFDVFIDSGAFSAENSGHPVNIDEYCKFLLDTKAVTYAGLDVIGDAKKTYENNKFMEDQYGLNPIPTFHMGGNIEDLAKIAGGQYSYIALGGLVFSSNVVNHCDAVWRWIMANNPKLRVHGFGITNLELMERYPWFSVDSSSFKSGKRYGRQGVLWNGFSWKTFEEEEYIEILRKMGHVITDPEKKGSDESKEQKEKRSKENRDRWFLYDFYSVQSYKIYAAHLKEINKTKKFEFLTSQKTLF